MVHPHLAPVDGTAALSSSHLLERELSKDRWDARNIPGFHYAPHTGNYYVCFTSIPETFRSVVKEYAKFLMVTGRSAQTLQAYTSYLGRFLAFYSERHPEAKTLGYLSEQDMDAFVLHLKDLIHARGWKKKQIERHVSALESFLLYLERIQCPLKPDKPTACIIWPHHHVKRKYAHSGQIKYIPQCVLKQLDTHLEHLPSTCIPTVILLRASGWRISDVLYLKWDSCLEQNGEKYCLIGDILKTQVLGHKIPITKEVATVALAQIAWVKQNYTEDENLLSDN